MQQSNEIYIAHQTGDKVRISSGDHKSQRGIIQTITDNSLEVKLSNGEMISISPQQVTNFSLAARKAWQTMRKQ
jgi:preprotein translocase subunit YajC